MMPECDCQRRAKERQYQCNLTGKEQNDLAHEVIEMLKERNCTGRDIRYIAQYIIENIRQEIEKELGERS